jgi:hypothetical protein
MAGATISVPLVWQALGTSDRPLVRFVHLLGAEGRPLAQADGVPCGGECPADSWVVGEVLRDGVSLVLAPDTPPGEYTLAVGWYDGETLQRLDVQEAEGAAEGAAASAAAAGLLPIATIQVTAP